MPRKLTRTGRIAKLDKVVSDIVRMRDGVCITCGTPDELTCSHFFTRRHYSTRWDLVNCSCQCRTCNYRHNKDKIPYYDWFVEKYSKERLYELEKKFWTKTNFKDYQLDEMYVVLKTYKDKVEQGIIT